MKLSNLEADIVIEWFTDYLSGEDQLLLANDQEKLIKGITELLLLEISEHTTCSKRSHHFSEKEEKQIALIRGDNH